MYCSHSNGSGGSGRKKATVSNGVEKKEEPAREESKNGDGMFP